MLDITNKITSFSFAFEMTCGQLALYLIVDFLLSLEVLTLVESCFKLIQDNARDASLVSGGTRSGLNLLQS